MAVSFSFCAGAAFVRQLTAEARRYAASPPEDPTEELRQRLKELNQRISRTMDSAASLQGPRPALQKIGQLEKQRKLVAADIASMEKEQGINVGMTKVAEPIVK